MTGKRGPKKNNSSKKQDRKMEDQIFGKVRSHLLPQIRSYAFSGAPFSATLGSFVQTYEHNFISSAKAACNNSTLYTRKKHSLT